MTEIKLLAGDQPVKLQNPSADFNQVYNSVDWGVTKTLDGDAKTGWAVYPQIGQSHFAIFETKDDAGAAAPSPAGSDGTTLTFVLDQQWPAHSIGKFRLSVTTSPRPANSVVSRSAICPCPPAITTRMARRYRRARRRAARASRKRRSPRSVVDSGVPLCQESHLAVTSCQEGGLAGTTGPRRGYGACATSTRNRFSSR